MIVLRGERVLGREGIEELLLNEVWRKLVREDHVVIHPAQVALASSELVQPKLNHREKEVDVRQAAIVSLCENSPVAIKKYVVVDSDYLDFRRKTFKIINELRPRVGPLIMMN